MSAPDSMVERVARALAKNHGTDPDMEGPGHRHAVEIDGVTTIVTDHFGPLWRMWVGDARAAIEAMREPTEAMIAAGNIPGWDDSVSIGLAEEVWQAMIDAALVAALSPKAEET